MKKIIAILLCMIFILTSLAACNSTEDGGADNTPPSEAPDTTDPPPSDPDTNEDPEPEPEPEAPEPIDPLTLTLSKTYKPSDGSVLEAYENMTAEDYAGVCQFYLEDGYELYGSSNLAGNLFSTFTRENEELAHVYWIEAHNELNIVTSDTGAETLPPRVTDIEGDIPISVTQLQQQPGQTSGMAYIVQLADGSFIIFDGGYADTVTELYRTLKSMKPEGEKIHIRAWIITHSHDDHFSCFDALADNVTIKKQMDIDYVLISPISQSDALSMDSDGNYFASTIYDDVKKIENTKLAYVYTGMVFTYGELDLEILFTANELFIDGNTRYFNDSSLVSRIYSNTPESGNTLSMIFLGDAGINVANRLMTYYGTYLRSDMCQASHHGVENFPLVAYQMIKASILWYPCNNSLYNLTNRDAEVRQALRASSVTKEILLRDNALYTRYLNPTLNPDPVK